MEASPQGRAHALRLSRAYPPAIKAYTVLLGAEGSTANLCHRSECYVRLAERLVSAPAAELGKSGAGGGDVARRAGGGDGGPPSEMHSGQDAHTLADLGLRDAQAVVEAGASKWLAEGHMWSARAHLLLEAYSTADTACGLGLAASPSEREAKELREEQLRARRELPQAAQPGAAPAAQAAGGTSGGEFDCPMCCSLFWEPVTSPCGHTFCRHCLARSLDHSNRCPICRTVLHITARKHPVTITLQKVIEKVMPQQLEARRQELTASHVIEAAEAVQVALLPLFMLEHVLPGQVMTLNIFEPRYRLMCRRCLDGERRFGMSAMEEPRSPRTIVGCEVEITESRQLHDGRYHIQVRATRRFRVQSVEDQDGYRCARVEFYQDAKNSGGGAAAAPSEAAVGALFAELDELKTEITTLVKEWLGRARKLGQHSPQLNLLVKHMLSRAGKAPDTFEAFSFWAANIVPRSTAQARKILRLTCTKDRMLEVRKLLQEVLAQTRAQEELSGAAEKRGAAGNVDGGAEEGAERKKERRE